MRIIKAIGRYDSENRFTLQGRQILYEDNSQHNDTQDIINVLFFNKPVAPTERVWLYGDGTPIMFGDGKLINT